jgi:glutathionyl-hydroquinone reductase
MRKLKGLEDVISFTVVDHLLNKSTGWSILGQSPDSTLDTVNGFKYLK